MVLRRFVVCQTRALVTDRDARSHNRPVGYPTGDELPKALIFWKPVLSFENHAMAACSRQQRLQH
jgi:hypothetical protein